VQLTLKEMEQVKCLCTWDQANATIVNLDVDRIAPVTWNKQVFDHLVVDGDTKELVYGTDLISGKGNGLIILFA
jgi:hypothetical protein